MATPENRCAAALTPVESAMLAALISSPSAYDPVNNPVDAQAQRNVVLEKMRDQGVLEVSDDDFQAMLDAPVPTKKDIQPPTVDSKAPYFTDWLRQQVVDKYGAGQAFGGGLVVKSTLDYGLQKAAEQAVSDNLAGLGPTSAVVAIDNGSGDVLAMVGGQDFDKSPFNLATNGQRQPGSSFKPFTLVTALREGHSPDETFESAPQQIPFKTTIRKNGKKKEVTDYFRVNNYDDNYLGSASIATATTYSDNSVYAQLGMEVGLNDIVKTAHELGITSRLDDNPAMILGGLKHGVTPLEMAYAYNTLANGGARISGTEASQGNGEGPVAIDKVVDQDDKPVPDTLGGSGENEKVSDQVVDPSVAQNATDILHTVVTSGTGERAQVGDDYIWGKTGTTDNNADAWFVGANEDITVAVWVGYPDGATPMETEFAGGPVDGGTIPALIFSDVVSAWDGLQASRGADDEHRHDLDHRQLRAAGDHDRHLRAAGDDDRHRRRWHRRRPRPRPRRRPPRPSSRRRPRPGPAAPTPAAPSPDRRQRSAGRPRQVRAVGQAVTPRVVGRLRQPDPRPGHDVAMPVRSRGEQRERLAQRIGTALAELDGERLADLARARAEIANGFEAAALPASLDAGGRLEGADEDGGRGPLGLGDEVEHRVDPVAEVDVGVAGRPEQRRVAPGRPAEGVAGGIAALIGLGLDDRPADAVVEQGAADQLGGHLPRRAGEELAVERRPRAPTPAINRGRRGSPRRSRAARRPRPPTFLPARPSSRATSPRRGPRSTRRRAAPRSR